jgi:PilZ domain
VQTSIAEMLVQNSPKASAMHKSSTRHYARYRTELPVIVKVLEKQGYTRIHGRGFELAQAGMGAVITSELAPGEMVTLEFSIPDAAQGFVIRAVVRHRMGFLHGFEFVGLLPEQRSHIEAFCRTLEPS